MLNSIYRKFRRSLVSVKVGNECSDLTLQTDTKELLSLCLEFDVRFNPDAYNEEVRHAESEVCALNIEKKTHHQEACMLNNY